MTFAYWIYLFMKGHDNRPGTGRFTCPSSQLLLRSPDMLISEASSSSSCFSLPQNWVIDLPWLFIFSLEWHSWEFFQLSWSNLYVLLFPERWQRVGEALEVPQHIQKGDMLNSTFVHVGWNSCSFFSSFLNLILHPLVRDSRLIYHPRLPLKPDFTTGTRR